MALLCTHVDDLLFASTSEGDRIIQHVLDAFRIGKVEKGTFQFCDFTTTVNVRDNTRVIRPVQIPASRKSTEPVTAQERTSWRSVVGSLAWIARAARPDISFLANVLQTQVATATVSTLHECNRVLDLAMRDANRGLTFKSGTLNCRKDLAICTDVSFAAQTGLKANKAESTTCLTMPPGHRAWKDPQCNRSMFSTEAKHSQTCLPSCRQKHIPYKPLWRPEARSDLVSRQLMRHSWYSDCRSLTEHLSARVLRPVTSAWE